MKTFSTQKLWICLALSLLTVVSFAFCGLTASAEQDFPLTMHQGASVRIGEVSGTGIRFCADVSSSVLDVNQSNHTATIKDGIDYSELGIIIVKSEILEGAQGDLFDYLATQSLQKSDIAFALSNDKLVYDQANGKFCFYAMITDIVAEDFAVDYQGIAYAYSTSQSKYVYSQPSAKRSVQTVFDLALKLAESDKHLATLDKALEVGSLQLTVSASVPMGADLSLFASSSNVIQSVTVGESEARLSGNKIIGDTLTAGANQQLTINYANGKSLRLNANVLSTSEYAEQHLVATLPAVEIDTTQAFGIDGLELTNLSKYYRNNTRKEANEQNELTFTAGEASSEQQAIYLFTKDGQVYKQPVTIWSLFIDSFEDLQAIKNSKYCVYKFDATGNRVVNAKGYYKLTADITAGAWTASNAITNYTNAFTYDKDAGFQGVFDGDGHTIDGLYLSEQYASIFGLIGENAVIRNVNFTNVSYKTDERIGALAYMVFGGKVENVLFHFKPMEGTTIYSGGKMSGAMFAWSYPISGSYPNVSGCSKLQLKDVTVVVDRSGANNTNVSFAVCGRVTAATGVTMTDCFVCENVLICDSTNQGTPLYAEYPNNKYFNYTGVTYASDYLASSRITATLTAQTKQDGESIDFASCLPQGKTLAKVTTDRFVKVANTVTYASSERGANYKYLLTCTDGSIYVLPVHVKSLVELLAGNVTPIDGATVAFNDSIDLATLASGIEVAKLYNGSGSEIQSVSFGANDMGKSFTYYIEDTQGAFYSIAISVKSLADSLASATELDNIDVEKGVAFTLSVADKTVSKAYSSDCTELSSLSITYTLGNAGKQFVYYIFTADGGFYKQPVTVWSLFIDSFDDLKAMKNSQNCVYTFDATGNKVVNAKGYYKLTADITAGDWSGQLCGKDNAATYGKTAGFQGVFDGGGHTIDGLKMTAQDSSLFGIMGENAIIRNVKFTNASIKEDILYSGLLATYAFGGTVENVTVQWLPHTNGWYSGGKMVGVLFGWCYMTSGTASLNSDCSAINLTDVTIIYDRSNGSTNAAMSVCGRLETTAGTYTGVDKTAPLNCTNVVICDSLTKSAPIFEANPAVHTDSYAGVTYVTSLED